LRRATQPRRRGRAALPIAFLVLAIGPLAWSPAPGRPAAVEAPPAAAAPALKMPNLRGDLKFAVLGDFGTGDKPAYELAAQMAKVFAAFKIDIVVLVGDNLIGSERPQDFKVKFEDPYKPLLDAGVKFYAALGNHDARAQKDYKLFNMGGKLYYSFKAPKEKVRFFMLDTTYPTPEQIDWLEKELQGSNDDWKIAVFHHPIYSSGGRHGSDLRLRETLEPLFIKYNVSVALSGHDHFYERIKPQHGIVHFIEGSGGRLAVGDIDKGSDLTATGFDTDQTFMVVEISANKLYFNAISRLGQIVDSGVVERRVAP
jgi:predicted MPP superfamily phosphohydrolase